MVREAEVEAAETDVKIDWSQPCSGRKEGDRNGMCNANAHIDGGSLLHLWPRMNVVK